MNMTLSCKAHSSSERPGFGLAAGITCLGSTARVAWAGALVRRAWLSVLVSLISCCNRRCFT